MANWIWIQGWMRMYLSRKFDVPETILTLMLGSENALRFLVELLSKFYAPNNGSFIRLNHILRAEKAENQRKNKWFQVNFAIFSECFAIKPGPSAWINWTEWVSVHGAPETRKCKSLHFTVQSFHWIFIEWVHRGIDIHIVACCTISSWNKYSANTANTVRERDGMAAKSKLLILYF